MNRKRYERKRPWPNLRNYPNICLKEPRLRRASVREAGVKPRCQSVTSRMQVKSLTACTSRLASTGIDCVTPWRPPPTHTTMQAVHNKLSCSPLRNNMACLFLCFQYNLLLITGGQHGRSDWIILHSGNYMNHLL
jgi:hypothetical protein